MGAHLRARRVDVAGTLPAALPTRWRRRAALASAWPMRAIQMTEFGGPEVLKLTELPVPEPGPQEVLIRVTRAGLNFADTHTRTNSYVRRRRFRSFPAARWPACARTPASGWSRSSAAAATPSTRSRRRSSSFPIPERDRRRHGARDHHPGRRPPGICIARPGAWRRGRASSCTPPPAASARWPCSSAMPLGAGRVIATRLERGEACAGARARRRRGDRPGAGGADRAPARGQRGPQVDVVFDMAGGEVFDASYEALAPFGRIVVCGIASEQPNQVAHRLAAAPLARGRRLLPVPLPGAPGHVRRCACRPVRAGCAGRAASGGRATPIRWSRPRRRRSTCASGAPAASCCSIRLGDPRPVRRIP